MLPTLLVHHWEYVIVMAGQHGQVEQETYDEGSLSKRILLLASTSWSWLRLYLAGSGEAAMTDAKAVLGIHRNSGPTAISMGCLDARRRGSALVPSRVRGRAQATG